MKKGTGTRTRSVGSVYLVGTGTGRCKNTHGLPVSHTNSNLRLEEHVSCINAHKINYCTVEGEFLPLCHTSQGFEGKAHFDQAR